MKKIGTIDEPRKSIEEDALNIAPYILHQLEYIHLSMKPSLSYLEQYLMLYGGRLLL
jgi:hypothetical protein